MAEEGRASLWFGPAGSQKLLAVGLLLASGVVAVYGVLSLREGEERVLYRGLTQEEAARGVERLRSAGMKARLGEDGQSLKVMSGEVDEARLVLAGEGIPSRGRTGFELLDGTVFGMTDFMERINYRRALEGELARTISALDEVADARVHLVMPRESLYSDKEEPAKASVSLTLRAGRRPERKAVAAVVHLVASAVEGLLPENVVVVDSQGRVLSETGDNAGGMPLSERQHGLQSQVEQELASKAIAILEPLVGPGGVRARASVEMNFDQSQQTEERYLPGEAAIRSAQKVEEQRVIGSEADRGGIPGTRSNPPEGTEQNVTTTSDRPIIEQKRNETLNYEVSKTVRHTSIPMGQVRRRSVAVVVDDGPVAGGATGKPPAKPPQKAPRSAEEMQKFRDLVVAALGLDVQAGDTISVENISFDTAVPGEPPATPSTWEQLRPYAVGLGGQLRWLLLALAFYLVVFRPLMRKIAEPLRVAEGQVRSLPSGARAGYLPGGAPALTAENPGAANDELEILRRVQALSQREPEQASQLLRGWLGEDRTR